LRRNAIEIMAMMDLNDEVAIELGNLGMISLILKLMQ